MDTAHDEKARVRAYWEHEPCGSNFADALPGSQQFYDQVRAHRYAVEPHIKRFADFESARDQSVLEIGVGMGTDFVEFARAGARVTGIDLTEAAVNHVRQRLELDGLAGDVRVGDAEALPFPDGTFDRVYSWGVLHHTPRTDRAILEAIRVVRPGGSLCVMLYHKHSWVTYAHWVKFALLRGRPRQSLDRVLRHHVESIGTKAYTRRELRHLFESATDVRIDVVGTTYDRHFAGPVAERTGALLGWNAVIRARAPVAQPRATAS